MKYTRLTKMSGFIRFLIMASIYMAGISESPAQNLVFSVSIPEIALVDVEPTGNNNITLDLTAPAEAGLGMPAVSAENNSLWLNYTCSKATGSPARNIYVQVAGTIPSGVQIRLQASAKSGPGGAGTFGTPASAPIILTNAPQPLVSGIGGCYTGNGIGFGHQLRYSIEISDYALIGFSGSTIIQISYTIADH